MLHELVVMIIGLGGLMIYLWSQIGPRESLITQEGVKLSCGDGVRWSPAPNGVPYHLKASKGVGTGSTREIKIGLIFGNWVLLKTKDGNQWVVPAQEVRAKAVHDRGLQ